MPNPRLIVQAEAILYMVDHAAQTFDYDLSECLMVGGNRDGGDAGLAENAGMQFIHRDEVFDIHIPF